MSMIFDIVRDYHVEKYYIFKRKTDDYRKFILKSKEQKNKRNKKWFGE